MQNMFFTQHGMFSASGALIPKTGNHLRKKHVLCKMVLKVMFSASGALIQETGKHVKTRFLYQNCMLSASGMLIQETGKHVNKISFT